MTPNLILSLFPGIDLFGRGFEQEGFCVVRGPDSILGQTIETFSPPCHVFEGIIAGPPCQDFSRARRSPPTGHGLAMLAEFVRCVKAAVPSWWLLENVPGVPDVDVTGYTVQRFNLFAHEFGLQQRRLRRFQFGYRDGAGLIVTRSATAGPLEPAAMASEARRAGRRCWADFCRLQGLPADFDLPGWSLSARYRAVGNGVPVLMARALAAAIRSRRVTADLRPCVCGCARAVTGKARHATAGCRKTMERRRRDASMLSGDRAE